MSPTARIPPAKRRATTWCGPAGTFILLSLALGIPGSPVVASQWWLAFTAFVGVNLLQSGLTKWCLMEAILRKLGAQPGG